MAMTIPRLYKHEYVHSNCCTQKRRRRRVGVVSLSGEDTSCDSDTDILLNYQTKAFNKLDIWKRGESPFDAEYSTDDEKLPLCSQTPSFDYRQTFEPISPAQSSTASPAQSSSSSPIRVGMEDDNFSDELPDLDYYNESRDYIGNGLNGLGHSPNSLAECHDDRDDQSWSQHSFCKGHDLDNSFELPDLDVKLPSPTVDITININGNSNNKAEHNSVFIDLTSETARNSLGLHKRVNYVDDSTAKRLKVDDSSLTKILLTAHVSVCNVDVASIDMVSAVDFIKCPRLITSIDNTNRSDRCKLSLKRKFRSDVFDPILPKIVKKNVSDEYISSRKDATNVFRRSEVIVIDDDIGPGLDKELFSDSESSNLCVNPTDSYDEGNNIDICSYRKIQVLKKKSVLNKSKFPKPSRTLRDIQRHLAQVHHCVPPGRSGKPVMLEEDQHVTAISGLHVSLIDSISDNGVICCDMVTRQVCEFVTRDRCPTNKVYSVLLNNLKVCSAPQCDDIFYTLQRVLSMHPLQYKMPFTYQDLLSCLLRMQQFFSEGCRDDQVKYNNYYMLRFYVDALQTEFTHCSLLSQRQVTRSILYQWFEPHSSLSNMRSVVNCMVQCVCSPSLLPHTPLHRCHNAQEELCHSVLLVLQQLLSLLVAASRHPIQYSNDMANIFFRHYQDLSTFAQRHLLLTLLCPLVKLYLTKVLFERNYERTHYLSHNFNMNDIVSAFFSSLPRQKECSLSIESLMSARCVIGGVDMPQLDESQVSDAVLQEIEDWEEFLTLLCILVQSYVTVKAEKLELPISRHPSTLMVSQQLNLSDPLTNTRITAQSQTPYQILSLHDLPSLQAISDLRHHVQSSCHGGLTDSMCGLLAELECYTDMLKL